MQKTHPTRTSSAGRSGPRPEPGSLGEPAKTGFRPERTRRFRIRIRTGRLRNGPKRGNRGKNRKYFAIRMLLFRHYFGMFVKEWKV